MKILAVAPYLSNLYGGIAQVVTHTVQATSQLGVTIDLVTTRAGSSDSTLTNDWVNQDSYKIRYFSCWHHNDFVVSPSLIIWLLNHVTEYDLIHIHTIFSPLISLVQKICQLYQVPYVVTPHGMLEPWALAYKSRKKRLYYHLIEKHNLVAASGIQSLAEPEAVNIQALGFKNTFTVPNGVEHQDFRQFSDSDIFYQSFPDLKNKTIILFLGRIDPKKGLDLLAIAFSKIHQRFPNTHLVIAGPDNIGFLETAQQYFIQADCHKAVIFTGMLTGNLKKAALRVAHLYVCPSYSEGFSMSILEAMASGLPCVITDRCNFPEAKTASAAYVIEANADAIYQAMKQCLDDPEVSQQMGDRARDFILKNYTWDIVAQKFLTIYSSIIKETASDA